MAKQIDVREIAYDVLLDIEKKKSFSNVTILNALKRYQFLSKSERAFINRLCEGVLENQILIDYFIDQVSKTKVAKCKPAIRVILRMGIYQIRFMDGVPNEAACNEAVKLAKRKGLVNLSGFVNGVLRGYIRNMDHILLPSEEEDKVKYLSVKYSMPVWLVETLLESYDAKTVNQILKASLEDKKTTIRCNESHIAVEDLITKLRQQQIQVNKGHYVRESLIIEDYNYLRRVDGFLQGDFTVQDESSMLAGLIAAPKKEDVVLDVCAAPGGKSLHIAEMLKGTGRVIARDVSEEKIERIQENIERCGYNNIETQIWDATKLDQTWIEKADIVMADVPCSGLGIMGRKNDIKYRVTEEQLTELRKLQRDILSVVWQYVKQDGVFVYSTCTIHPKENNETINWFLEQYPFTLEDISPYLPEALVGDSTKKGYLQLLQGVHACDGFFIARMRRKA